MKEFFQGCLVVFLAAAAWAVIEVIVDVWRTRRRLARLRRDAERERCQVSYAQAEILLREGWQIAPEEDHNRTIGLVWLERFPRKFSAPAETEKERATVQVEPGRATTDKPTGTGVSDGDHAPGPGGTPATAMREATWCAQCHRVRFICCESDICTQCAEKLSDADVAKLLGIGEPSKTEKSGDERSAA